MALCGESDGGLEQAAPGEAAFAAMSLGEAFDQAGRGRGEPAGRTGARRQRNEHVARGGVRCLLAEVEAEGLAIGQAREQMASSAEAAHPGLRDRESERGGNGCVDDASTFSQNGDGRVGGVGVRGGDHGAAAVDGQGSPAFEVFR